MFQRRIEVEPEVFICHAPEDRSVADALCGKLKKAGLRFSYSPRDVPQGIEWHKATESSIDKARVVVIVLSAAANHSAQVKREVERAVNGKKIAIPLRLDGQPLAKSFEYYLSTAHWLDASTPPLERHLDRLTEAVRQLLTGEESGGYHQRATFRPPPRRRSKKAIIALILGISGLLIGGAISGVIAMVLGQMELRAIARGRSSPLGRNFARAGLILGCIDLVMSLAITFANWYWDLNLFVWD